METFVEKISTETGSLSPAPALPKPENEVFCAMIVKMLAAIEYSEEKYLLKLRIQQNIAQTPYATRKISSQQSHIQYHTHSRSSPFMLLQMSPTTQIGDSFNCKHVLNTIPHRQIFAIFKN